MPLRVTITPAGQARLLPVPLVLREAVDGFQRILNGVIGRSEIPAEVGRIDRYLRGCLIVSFRRAHQQS